MKDEGNTTSQEEVPTQMRLRAAECTRETTCALCGGPMSPGDWTVRIRGRDNHTHCAGDEGYEIE